MVKDAQILALIVNKSLTTLLLTKYVSPCLFCKDGGHVYLGHCVPSTQLVVIT